MRLNYNKSDIVSIKTHIVSLKLTGLTEFCPCTMTVIN